MYIHHWVSWICIFTLDDIFEWYFRGKIHISIFFSLPRLRISIVFCRQYCIYLCKIIFVQMKEDILNLTSITPPKTNMEPENGPWKRRFLLETIISRFHVSFRGGIHKLFTSLYTKQVLTSAPSKSNGWQTSTFFPPNVSLSEIRRLNKALWRGNLMVHKRLFKARYFWGGGRYVRGGRLTFAIKVKRTPQELSRRTLRCDVLSFHVAMRWAPWRRASNFLELLMSQALQADVVSYTLAGAWALWWQKTWFYRGMSCHLFQPDFRSGLRVGRVWRHRNPVTSWRDAWEAVALDFLSLNFSALKKRWRAEVLFWKVTWNGMEAENYLGGGFKHFLFSPLLGEMIKFD